MGFIRCRGVWRYARTTAAEAFPHIFEKFYRAPNALAGGSGLGLSIVKGFVEAHAGRVEARDGPAGGVEFIIRLPLGEAPPPPT